MSEKKTIGQRIRRFWQSLTGSGVQSYSDEPLPGTNDGSPAQQANADIQHRNRMQFGTKG